MQSRNSLGAIQANNNTRNELNGIAHACSFYLVCKTILMEIIGPDDLSGAEKTEDLAEMFKEALEESPQELAFEGIIYEDATGEGEFYAVLYEGMLLAVVDDQVEPSARLWVNAKSLCIRNGSDGVERTAEEALARLLDPPEDADPGEWEPLQWVPREVTVSLRMMDTVFLTSTNFIDPSLN